MLPEVADVMYIDKQNMLQTIIWKIQSESQAAANNGQTLIMIFLGCGEPEIL